MTINQSWERKLKSEFAKDYFKNLEEFVNFEYQKKEIYPPKKLIYNAFNKCSFEDVKVVIIGQDPYHGVGQANGLSFSVASDIKLPRSLQNIFKEIKNDLNIEIPKSGNLERWAEQGVLLLNAVLTVEAGNPNSHKNKGWEVFTDTVIELLSKKKSNIVYMLWGNYAQKKGEIINSKQNLILKSNHPSPLSANRGGWFNKHQFSTSNLYLKEHGLTPIKW